VISKKIIESQVKNNGQCFLGIITIVLSLPIGRQATSYLDWRKALTLHTFFLAQTKSLSSPNHGLKHHGNSWTRQIDLSPSQRSPLSAQCPSAHLRT